MEQHIYSVIGCSFFSLIIVSHKARFIPFTRNTKLAQIIINLYKRYFFPTISRIFPHHMLNKQNVAIGYAADKNQNMLELSESMKLNLSKLSAPH